MGKIDALRDANAKQGGFLGSDFEHFSDFGEVSAPQNWDRLAELGTRHGVIFGCDFATSSDVDFWTVLKLGPRWTTVISLYFHT